MNTSILLDVVRDCEDTADWISHFLAGQSETATKEECIDMLKAVMDNLYANYRIVKEDGEWMV